VKLDIFYLLAQILLIRKDATFCGKFNQENMHQTLSESSSFYKRYDKNILGVFSVHCSNCCSLAKCEC